MAEESPPSPIFIATLVFLLLLSSPTSLPLIRYPSNPLAPFFLYPCFFSHSFPPFTPYFLSLLTLYTVYQSFFLPSHSPFTPFFPPAISSPSSSPFSRSFPLPTFIPLPSPLPIAKCNFCFVISYPSRNSAVFRIALFLAVLNVPWTSCLSRFFEIKLR